MQIPQQTASFLNKTRQTGPIRYNAFSDEQLYSILSRKNQIPESAAWKEKDKQTRKSQGLSARPQQDLGFFARTADWFVNEDSYDWMKAGYNRSLGGMTEQLITGDQRYNVDEEDFTLLQDIGASLISFFMPLDLLTLGAGSLAGKAVAGTALKQGLFGNALKEAAKAGAKKGLAGKAADDFTKQAIAKILSDSKLKSALIGATRQAPALALYEGAVEGVQAKLNGEDVFPAIAKGVFHGGVMGALTGGIGGGMGAKQAQILAQTKGNPLGKDKIRAYGIYGMPGQIAAESSVFSISELGHKLAEGEDLDADSILRTFARNVGLFSGLKLVHKGLGKGAQTGGEYWKKGKEFWKDTEREYVERKKAEKDAMDGLEKTVNEKTNGEGLAEVAAQKAGFDVEVAETQGRLKQLKKDADYIMKAFESNDSRKVEDNPVLIKRLNKQLEAIKQELEGKSNKTSSQEQLLDGAIQLKDKITNDFNKYEWVDGKVKPKEASKENIIAGLDLAQAKTEMPDKTIRTEAKKYGIDIPAKSLADPAKKERILERIFMQAEAEQIKSEKIAQAPLKKMKKELLPIVEEGVGMIREPFKGRKLGISKEKLERFYRNTGETATTKWPKGTPKNLIQKRLNEISKINEDPLLQTSIEQSLTQIKPKKGDVATGTITQYGARLKTYVEYLKNKKIDFYEVGAEDIRLYFESKGKKIKNLKPGDVAPLRNLYNWTSSKQGLNAPDNPAAWLNSVFNAYNKQAKLRKKELPSPESFVKKISKFVSDLGKAKNNKPVNDRAKLMLEIANEVGIRNQELFTVDPINVPGSGLSVKDFVHLKKGKILKGINTSKDAINVIEMRAVTDKQGQPRIIPISNKLAKSIKKFIDKYKLKPNEVLLGDKFKDQVRKIVNAKIKTGYDKAVFDDFRDMLQQEMFFGTKANLTATETRLINNMLGHERTTIQSIYGKDVNRATLIQDTHAALMKILNAREGVVPAKKSKFKPKKGQFVQWESQGALMFKEPKKVTGTAKKNGQTFVFVEGSKTGIPLEQIVIPKSRPIKKSPATKRQLAELKEKLEATQELVETQKQFFEKIPAYKNIKILTNQKLGKVKGERVLGQITGHTVKIAEGKVRPDTLPHEISHYAVDVLRKFGTKKDMDLIKRGEKMFKSEEKLVQAIGEYAQGKLKNKTLISKVKTWIKSFNARLKDMLGMATKADVAYLLSRKVVKGNIPLNRKVKNFVNQLETHYQTDSKVVQAEYGKIGKPFEKEILDKYSTYGMKKADMDALRESYNIPKEGTQKGWIKEGKVSLGQVKQWADELREIKLSKKKINNKLEDLNKEYGINRITSEGIAKSLGSLDGSLSSLTSKSKKIYQEVVKEGATKTERFTAIDAIAGMEGNVTWQQKLINGFLPVYEVLKKFNLGKVAHSGGAWERDFNRIRGRGKTAIDTMSEVLRPRYGKKELGYWDLFDRERALHRIKQSGYKLDSKNKKFIIDENYKKPEWWVDSKHSLSKDKIQFIENILFDKTSPEYQAQRIWDNYSKQMWKLRETAAKKNLNPAEFEKFLEEHIEKHVTGYFSRVATKDLMKHGVESGAIEKAIKEKVTAKASKFARKQASKKHKKGTEQYDALYEKLKEKYEIELEPEIYKSYYYQSIKDNKVARNTFLMERGPLLDEFIQITDASGKTKVIRTYEHTKRKSAEKYVEGMSKNISTVRHFPEFTDLGGTFGSGSTIEAIARLGIKDTYASSYALKGIRRLIGAEKADVVGKGVSDLFAGVAHTSAAIGLSSPTSGIKNFLIGMPRNVATYGPINTMRGMAKVLTPRAWKEAKEKGILNYAPDTLELGKTPGSIMEKLFKFNLMTSTENINRIVAVEAGKLAFRTKLDVLRNKPGLFSNFRKRDVRRMLKDVWQVPEKDRLFLETADLTLPKNRVRYENIIKHVEQMSHFSTQGGTSAWRLPLWASSSIAKPFTLFQRMAYATTYDSAKNYFKPALQYGNFAPLTRAALGHYFAGIGLYGLYKYLFQTEPPKSASTELDKATMYLWRSEFLGLFGEAISPYDKGDFQMLSAPVINRNLVSAGDNLFKWLSGDQSLMKFINKTALETVVLYNQYDTMKKTSLSKEYSNARKINNWERQFYIDRRGEFKMSSKQEFSRRQVYYKDLKEAIYVGDEQKIAKAYYAAYNYIISELERMEGKTTMAWKHKKAKSALKSSLRAMEPGNISAETGKGVIMSKKADFLKFIQEKFGDKGSYEFRQAVRDYEKLKSSYEKIINNKKYWNKYSAYSSLNLK